MAVGVLFLQRLVSSRFFCFLFFVLLGIEINLKWFNLIYLIYIGLERNGKSCRLRWINYLRPGLKRGMFSQQEQQTILSLHHMLGNKSVFFLLNPIL